MTLAPRSVWQSVRVRYLVIAWLLPIVYLPGANFVFSMFAGDWPWYWWNLAYIYYMQAFLGIVVTLTATVPSNVPLDKVVGRAATREEYIGGFKLSAYLFILAVMAAYAVFLPLSYWVPTFVEYWFIELPDLIYYDAGVYPFIPNLLNLVSLCVLAPIIEEFAFRGVILHRWALKYGLKMAVFASSFLFAIVHPDPVGAFFFGLGMCALYLRTQSLVLPVVCHGVYNFVVWLFELGYILHDGPEYEYTLEQFQNEWPVGVIAAVIVALWTSIYARSAKTTVPWKLPVI